MERASPSAEPRARSPLLTRVVTSLAAPCLVMRSARASSEAMPGSAGHRVEREAVDRPQVRMTGGGELLVQFVQPHGHGHGEQPDQRHLAQRVHGTGTGSPSPTRAIAAGVEAVSVTRPSSPAVSRRGTPAGSTTESPAGTRQLCPSISADSRPSTTTTTWSVSTVCRDRWLRPPSGCATRRCSRAPAWWGSRTCASWRPASPSSGRRPDGCGSWWLLLDGPDRRPGCRYRGDGQPSCQSVTGSLSHARRGRVSSRFPAVRWRT